MNRREMLKLLLTGVAGVQFDVEKLLWIPGQKTIFLPTLIKPLTMSEIIEMELMRITPYLKAAFERDDLFYAAMSKKPNSVRSRTISIPLTMRPGA